MFFSRLFRSQESPRSRVTQISNGLAQLESGEMEPDEVQREIDRLIELKEQNRDIEALSATSGWKVIEEELSAKALEKLHDLPHTILILNDIPKARAMASYILFADALLSGVSEPLLASAHVDRLLRTRLTMQEIFERESNAGI